MDSQAISNIISAAAVVAAIITAVIALLTSRSGERRALNIATEDRRESLRQAYLFFELQHLSRLAENNLRGGSTDPEEVSRLGAEALMLVGLIGPHRIPDQYEHFVGPDERLAAARADPDMPHHKRDAQETQLAVSAVLREIRQSIARQEPTLPD